MESEPKCLDWAKRLQAIAQNGLTFAENPFDIERYQAARRIAAEMISQSSGVAVERIHGLLSGEEGYQTPKVDVRVVVEDDDALLMVKERPDSRWTLARRMARCSS